MKSLLFVAIALLVGVADGRTITLSNIQLPTCTDGSKLITGEADVMHHQGAYYLYFNNWGDCPGVDCCDDPKGCATCCFNNPPHPYLPGCGNNLNGSDPYGSYHTVQAYKTVDFVTFENLGVALPLKARLPGIEFRPHVVYNNLTKRFLMWYEDRGSNLQGYAVAQSDTPGGPFETTHYNVTLPGAGRTGDFDVFIDDDGSAYHIRTGFDIVKLNNEFTGPAEHVSSFSTPKSSEGPVVFKRAGKYYVLSGTGCCACIGGSTIYGTSCHPADHIAGLTCLLAVDMADSLAGPWVFAGDVGSNPTPFDMHSPHNYVTKAQASTVFEVLSETGETQYVWMGNQWNSGLSETPPGPRKHDLLYWSVLQFNPNGTLKQVEYQTEIEIDLPAEAVVPLARAKTTVTVATAPASAAVIIPPNFVGFSTENEPKGVGEMLSTGFHTALRNLYQTTAGDHDGPVVRVGGNSADTWCFHSNHNVKAAPTNCTGTFNETTIKQQLAFATLAADIRVKFVIDVNFGLSADPTLVAVPHVQALTAAGLWPHINAVEIGNEMDIYAEHSTQSGKPHHRDPAYNYDRYATEFGVYERAFEASGMPAGSVQGATWASSRWYNRTSDYLRQYGAKMSSFSLHKYARTSCGSAKPVTLAALLSYTAAEGNFNDEWDEAVAASKHANIPMVIGEGNSISCGGTTGVSDTAAAALWVLDFLPWASKHGASGMQFHGGPHGPYAAVSFNGGEAGVPSMHPLYYGLLAFSELVGNYSRWLSTAIDPPQVPVPTAHADPRCKNGIRTDETCCAASCGMCGGTSCGNEPGGSGSCCAGTIMRANNSCNSHAAPCVLEEDWGPPLVVHSTVDVHNTIKVLVVTKDLNQAGPEAVSVCLNSSSTFAVDSTATVTATAAVLHTPKGAKTKVGDGMQWAGQSFDRTTDGTASGARSVSTVASYPSPSGAQVCFDVSVPPLSAVLLTVQTTQ